MKNDQHQSREQLTSELLELRRRLAKLEATEPERKRAEEELETSAKWLSTTLRSIGDAVIATDARGHVALMNPVAQALTGWDEVDAKDKPLKDVFNIVNEETGQQAENPTTRVIREGVVVGLANHTILIARDGTRRPVDNSGAPIRDDMGNTTGVILVFRDITERKQAEEELRGSEEKYRSLFEQTLNGFAYCQILVDENNQPVDFVYLEVNDAFERLTGLRREDIIGRKVTEAIPGTKESHPELFSIYGKVALTGEEAKFDIYFEPLEIWLTISVYSPQRGYFVAIFDNITERKRVEQELGEAEAELKHTIEVVPGIIAKANAHTGYFTECNPALTSILGFSSDEFLARPFIEFVHPDDHQDTTNEVEKQLDGSPIARFENRYICKDGTYKWLEWRATATDEKGVVYAAATDITERKQAEEALKESEQRYRLLFERSGDAIYLVDRQTGRYLDANASAEQLTGYSVAELKTMTTTEISPIGAEERLRQLATMEDNLDMGEVTYIHRDGTTHTALLTAVRLGEDRIFGIARDITERKMLEEERQKTERLESVGTLAGGIAHDFNNILTGIMGNIALARRHLEPGSKAAERLEEAERGSIRAKDLTQQLLTFARGGTPIKKVVSLTGLLKDSTTFALAGSNVRPVFSIADNLWAVETDEGQISQVIRNLVINADEAMPDGGTLNVGARNTIIQADSALPLSQGKYLEITVEDHGVGISKGYLGKIFDPYFSTKQKGSGLGLATTYAIIKNHGGHITVESTQNVGTTFHIFLPASEKPAPLENTEADTAPTAGMGNILVMDDEDSIRQLLYQVLTGVGYEVTLSSDGAEAIKLYRRARKSRHPFDAVILDLTVPGSMGGKQVIRKLLEIDPEVKAIVSSGYSTDPVMSEFRQHGFKGVVTKPYNLNELEETLRDVLAGKK